MCVGVGVCVCVLCFCFVFVFVLCVLMMLVELVSFFGGIVLLNLDVITASYFQIQHCIFDDEGGWWLIFVKAKICFWPGRGSVSVSFVGLWACTVSCFCVHDFDAEYWSLIQMVFLPIIPLPFLPHQLQVQVI